MSSEGIPGRPVEKTELTPEAIEAGLAQEQVKLEGNIESVNTNLDEIDASSPGRMQKIEDFFDKNYFTLIGGSIGTGGAFGIGESLISGSWQRAVIGLALGAGVGKGLEMLTKRLIEKQRGHKS